MVICGLDEAGRGALAGPLMAAAVVINQETKHKIQKDKLKDGKLLTALEREEICRRLRKSGAIILVETISARSINNHGIGWANKEIFRRLIKKVETDKYIVDGKLKIGRVAGKTDRIQSIVDADATIPEVILAGIVAKVERDKIMRQLHKEFRRYHWKINKGYGTKKHLAAIQKYGPCRYHRDIFVTTALKKGV
ncbi:ribonuclease HII [Patescibacteria group bacterium]|nr:ribonuclease HII [Patescibacteria group bacterium]